MPTAAPYTIAVSHTDRTRQADGSFTTYIATVTVLASDPMDAKLVAMQMAGAIRCDLDCMVTGATILAGPTS